MNLIPWQHQVRLAKQATEKIPDPDALLRKLPPGTSDTCRVLAALLAKFNHFHATKDKIVSHKTRQVRGDFYFTFFRQLRTKTKYRCTDPRQLGARHVGAMLEVWIQEGLEAGTIEVYLSYLRTFCDWIGKPNLVPSAIEHVGKRRAIPKRRQDTTTDKSWEAHGVDATAMIAKVTELDQWVGAQLALELHFGLRSKEARFFRPHDAVVERSSARVDDAEPFPEAQQFVRLRYGTKGGRVRDVAMVTDAQRQLLEQVKGMVPPGGFVGRQHHTPDQSENRYRWILRRAGITKKALRVTAHGLRHGYANDLYEDKAGAPSPVRGGTTKPERDDQAREAVARALGHGRKRISGYYIGAILQPRRDENDAEGNPNAEDSSSTA
jgi:integrase